MATQADPQLVQPEVNIEPENGISKGDELNFADEQLAVATDDAKTSNNRFLRFIYYILAFAIPGGGMFCEAYFVFSVGNLKPIWVQVRYIEFHDVFSKHPRMYTVSEAIHPFFPITGIPRVLGCIQNV